MKPAISVVVLTWRPGGFGCFVPALLAQKIDVPYELIVVDELHRWRAPATAPRLAKLPFPVKHLLTERSLFPVASTMRAGNTAIKAAEGELIVHLCDHAVPPPNFLQAHWDAHVANPRAVGLAPYKMRRVKPESWLWKDEPMQLWPFLEQCARGLVGPDSWWSILANPDLWSDEVPDLDRVAYPWDQWTGSGLVGVGPGPVDDEWGAHYKTDSVPLAGYHKVNGWDEEYDGAYAYGDVDMSLRLMAAGYELTVVGCEVDVLDAHAPVKRLPDAAFRDYDAERLLQRTRDRVAGGGYFCDFGLELTETAKSRSLAYQHVKNQKLSQFLVGRFPRHKMADSVELTLVRPWLSEGRITLKLLPSHAFIWSLLTPPLRYVGDVPSYFQGYYEDVLGEQTERHDSIDAALAKWVETTVVCGAGPNVARLDAMGAFTRRWLIYVGADVDDVARWAEGHGYPALAAIAPVQGIAVRVG